VIKINGLKPRRIEAGLSQKQLAEMLQVTQAAVANWEAGTAYPRASQLPDLAKALSCTIDELYAPPEKTA
jgi:transcriptional regulator with XRE-family HTH domain